MLCSSGFESGGIYVMRHGDAYMIVDCGRNGLNDWGGHAHNDTLSFELAIAETTFLVDPGSYAYTSSREWHERFRSTAYHNVVMIDREEINRFKTADFWGLHNDAIPKVKHWQTTDTFDLLDVQHTGYLRLESPVLHRRQFLFNKDTPQFWVIRDILSGSGHHSVEVFFHVGDATITLLNPLIVDLESHIVQDTHLVVFPVNSCFQKLTLENACRASSYGRKTNSTILKYGTAVRMPAEFVTVLWRCQSRLALNLIQDQVQTAVESALKRLNKMAIEQVLR